MAAGKKEDTAGEKEAKPKKQGIVMTLLEIFKYIFLGFWYLIKGIYKGIVWLIRKITLRELQKKDKEEEETAKGRKARKLKLIEKVKGDYEAFWDKLVSSDSMIGIVLGSRGSGKTAFALNLMEHVRAHFKNFYAMGFQQKNMPAWVDVIDRVEDIKNDGFAVIDEGGILFSSRESMSDANKMLSELLMIARHKNLTIVFISQNSANIEVNTLRQADFLVLRRSSLLQSEFERKIIAKIYEENKAGFEKHKAVKGLSLIYAHNFVGFVENELPSFWSEKVSKSFR